MNELYAITECYLRRLSRVGLNAKICGIPLYEGGIIKIPDYRWWVGGITRVQK